MSKRFINVDDLDIFYAELLRVFATKCDLINVNPNIEGFQNITVHTDASNIMLIYAEGYMYSDDYSIAEGFYAEVDPDTLRLRLVNYGGNEASGILSHAKGSATQASGRASSSEGSSTVASGDNSHAEGIQTTAAGYGAHAEGSENTVNASYAHAEGTGNTINEEAEGSHIEGADNEVGGRYSHIEGLENRIEGDLVRIPTAVHVEGYDNKAYRDADYAHVEGVHNEVRNPAEFAAGYGNVSTKSDNPSKATLFSVGCGGENAMEIKLDGTISFKDLYTLTFYEEANGYISKQKVWDGAYLTQFPALFSNDKQWFPDKRALNNIKLSLDCFAIAQNIDADNTIIVKIDSDSSISDLNVGLAPIGTITISPTQVTYTSDYKYYRYTLSDPYGRNLASLQNNSDTVIKDIIFPTRDADHAITIDCQGLQNLEKIFCGGYYRLGSYAFRDADSLNTLYLSLNHCTSIDTYSFAQSSLTDVYITNPVFDSIPSATFAGASEITLHVPNVNLDAYIANVHGFKQIVGYAL